MNFKQEKYIEVIKYILLNCCNKKSFGKTVLCSLLYFIDFNYYESYGELLTNETYIKSKTGIKPIHFTEISEKLIAKKQIFLRKKPYYNRIIYKYYLTTIPIIKFNSKELKIIDLSLNKLSNTNATTITQYAIKNPQIHVTNLGEIISFNQNISKKYLNNAGIPII